MNTVFHPYRPQDLNRCTELSVSAWPIVNRLARSKNAHEFMRVYVLLGLAQSDYAEVCCQGEKVVGLLFGATGDTPLCPEQKRESRNLLWAFVRGRYGRMKHHLRFLFGFVYSALKFEFLCSRFDSEVTLFIVDKAHRRQGLGRALMDHFIDHARANKRKTVYLGTDVESSWGFYEHYGFEKDRDFHDNGLSVMRGKRTQSFIYYYDLRNSRRKRTQRP